MVFLALDTSLSGCHVAVYDPQSKRVFERLEVMQRGQSECLLPLIIEILAEAGADFKDIKFTLAVNGPGSFTGLRVGLSAARTIAQTTGCKAIGLSSFDALRFQQVGDVAVIIESRRDDFYVSVNGEDMLIHPVDFLLRYKTQLLNLIGDGVDRFLSLIPAQDHPSGWNVIGLQVPPLGQILSFCANGGQLAEKPLTPYYLREPDVTLSKVS